MLDHVSIGVRHLREAGVFYDAALGALGHARLPGDGDRLRYGTRNSADDDSHTYLSVVASDEGGNWAELSPGGADELSAGGRHWAFRASPRGRVDAFHAAALAAGGRDDGPPGLRPEYHAAYYAAFVIDPSGNRIEAVCHRAG